MGEPRKLGGTRQSAPLEDEMTYPLTKDEYLMLRENLIFDKFSNWESFLLSTLITTLISWFVIYFTGSVYKIELVNDIKTQIVDISQVVTLTIYAAISFGCLIGLIMSMFRKKASKSMIDRLDTKITGHLSN